MLSLFHTDGARPVAPSLPATCLPGRSPATNAHVVPACVVRRTSGSFALTKPPAPNRHGPTRLVSELGAVTGLAMNSTISGTPARPKDVPLWLLAKAVSRLQQLITPLPSEAAAHSDPRGNPTATWQIQRTSLPSVRRTCPDCTTSVSVTTGKFRVNANGKLLDVWLLTRCAHCGHNARIKVHHRTHVQSFDPEKLSGYMDNDPELVAETLFDPLIARRNHYTLDWTDAWKLTVPENQPVVDWRMNVQVHFDIPVPVRPVRIIAQGLQLSRGEVERMITDGRITSAIELSRKTSSTFDFSVAPNSP